MENGKITAAFGWFLALMMGASHCRNILSSHKIDAYEQVNIETTGRLIDHVCRSGNR